MADMSVVACLQRVYSVSIEGTHMRLPRPPVWQTVQNVVDCYILITSNGKDSQARLDSKCRQAWSCHDYLSEVKMHCIDTRISSETSILM